MAFLGEECYLSEFGIGQHQIKAEKKVHLCVPDCLPHVFRAGECWHLYAHISFRATVDLQTELIPSPMVSVPPPT